MQPLKRLTMLSILPLLCLPAAAQMQGGNRGAAGGDEASPTRLEIAIQARPHVILPSLENPQRVVVKEAPGEGGMSRSPRGGAPDLGMRVVNILLPYDARVRTVKFTILHEDVVSLGFFNVAPVGLGTTTEPGNPQELISAIPSGVQLDQLGQDVAIYGSQEPWPERAVGVLGAARHRALRYIRVVFQPFSWNPDNHELIKRENLVLGLEWERRPIPRKKRAKELGDPVSLSEMGLERFVNDFDAVPWYEIEKRPTEADYLIVTTEELIAGSLELGNFVALKESQGHSVLVESVEDIDARFGLSSRAEGIRRFVRQEYLKQGIRNLLLIGHPDPRNVEAAGGDFEGSVPMMMLWPGGTSTSGSVPSHRRSCATDAYFGELTTANWDRDGDGRLGEWWGDSVKEKYQIGTGSHDNTFHDVVGYPCDFDMEVDVARIPFDDSQSVDEFLAAVIHYQTTTNPFELMVRSRVYLAMAEMSPGSTVHQLGRDIELALVLNSWPFIVERLFQVTPFDMFLGMKTLPNQWSLPTGAAGLVVWTGSGSTTESLLEENGFASFPIMAFRLLIESADVAGLHDLTRAIVTQACSWNGNPETNGNLVDRLLDRISVGGYACSGLTWNSPGRFSETFGHAGWVEDLACNTSIALSNGVSVGKALSLHRRHVGNPDSIDIHGIQVLLGMNAYGDPAGTWQVQLME